MNKTLDSFTVGAFADYFGIPEFSARKILSKLFRKGNKMSMHKTTTAKSVIYKFDGFSEGYGCCVQGAFYGTFIVPIRHTSMLKDNGYEFDTLREMHQARRFGLILRNSGHIQ